MDERLCLDLPVLWGQGSVGHVSVFLVAVGVGGVGGEWVGGLDQGWERWWVVLYLCEVSVWILCVDDQVSVYCGLADTCTSEVHSVFNHVAPYGFMTCICLWQISHIQNCLFKVVGPGLVSTSPVLVSSSTSHPAGPHGRHAPKTVNRAPIAGSGKVRHNLHSSLSPL